MIKTVTLISSKASDDYVHLQQISEHLDFHLSRISVFGNFINVLNDPNNCPDLVLFEIQALQQFDKISLTEMVNMIHSISFCSHAKKTPILAVMIDELSDKQMIAEIQGTCIKGYVLNELEEGKSAISELLAGRTVMPKNILAKFKKEEKSKKADGINLTTRQQQVLKLVCNRGLSNKGIAQVLKISESTVKIHISAILKEYGVRNRTQLALVVSSSLKP